MSRGRWQDRAACRGHDPEIWFDEDRLERAVAICNTCPVIAECRDFGRRSTAGVWAGESREHKGARGSLTNEFLEEHGTPTGYNLHITRGEQPCGRCSIAHTFAAREWESRSPQARKRVSA